MSEQKESLVRKIVVRVIATLVCALVLSLVATVIPGGWAWFFSSVRGLGQWLLSRVNIPVWVLLLFCIASIAVLVGAAILLLLAIARKSDHVLKYTEDTFFGIRWSWRYFQGGIDSLAAFCPDCDYQMQPRFALMLGDHATVYHCDECDRDVNRFDVAPDEVADRVKRKIQKNIRQKIRDRDADRS